MDAVPTKFETTADGALIVASRMALPQAIRIAPRNATIEVPTETLVELAKIAAGPDRLNRTDLSFRVAVGQS